MGRPSKLGTHIVSAFREVLSDEMNILACTDRQLFCLLNDQLAAHEKVSYRSFQRYKAHAMTIGAEMEDCETDEELAAYEAFDPVYRTMYNLFTLALINQKKVLLYKILDEEQGWRRYQWMLERKFREWNLRFDKEDLPIDIDTPKVPEVKVVALTPEPKPVYPPIMVFGIIEEKSLVDKIGDWLDESEQEPNLEEIVECRLNEDLTIECRIVNVGRKNTVSHKDSVKEYYFNYQHNHYKGEDPQFTVRMVPPEWAKASATDAGLGSVSK